jgi:LAO/AO transport system kinase
MELLSREPDAYIRHSPSQGTLGGVAQKTRETMVLCEAAGYDVVLVETVGVGQSEYQVAAMVDFFMEMMLPNAGDELQGIKKGIIELADALVVNKADGESINLAQQTQRHYQNALHLLKPNSFWTQQVVSCSAQNNEKIDAVWSMVSDFYRQALANNAFANNRSQQNKDWMQSLLFELLEQKLMANPAVKTMLPLLQKKVIDAQTTPLIAAKTLIDLL